MHSLDGMIEIMCRLQQALQREDEVIVFSADDEEERRLYGGGTSFSGIDE